MKESSRRLIGLLLVISIAAVGCAPATPAVQASGSAQATASGQATVSAKALGSVKLGLIAPLTGGASFFGERQRQGAELAVEIINQQGGVLGKRIELVIEDNQTDNAQAVSLLRKVAADPAVVAIIGPVQSGTYLAGASVAGEIGIVWASPGAGASWPQGLPNKWNFRNTYPFDRMVTQFVETVLPRLGAKKVASIYNPDNLGVVSPQEIGSAAFKKLGITEDPVLTAKSGTLDFGPQITKLLQDNPPIVAVNLVTADAVLFMKQARQRGLTSQFISGALGLVDLQVVKLSGGAAEGTIVPATFDPSSDKPETKKFVDAWIKKYSKFEDLLSAYAYDMVFTLKAAMEKANSTTDRAALRDAFGQIKDLCLAGGCYSWNGSGDPIGGSIFPVQLTQQGFKRWP